MQIIKSVLCVTMLLTMLSYHIGPKGLEHHLKHCGLSH
jgi:hypothetical protein